MMRIITGRARGTKLVTLEGQNTRPTAERAKEAVFSMLQFELRDAEVLDLFAGSGQMALEAVSRGAAHATMVDASPDAVAIIRKNVEKTHFESDCTVLCSDYAAFLRRSRSADAPTYDLVFIDPPYALRLVCPALRALMEGKYLSDGAKLVCESEEEDIFEADPALLPRFEVLRSTRYGAAHMTVLRYLGNG